MKRLILAPLALCVLGIVAILAVGSFLVREARASGPLVLGDTDPGYALGKNDLLVLQSATNEMWIRFKNRPTSLGYSQNGIVWQDERGDCGLFFYSSLTGSFDMASKCHPPFVWWTENGAYFWEQYRLVTSVGDLVLTPANVVRSERPIVVPCGAEQLWGLKGSVNLCATGDIYQANKGGAFARLAALEARVTALEAQLNK